MTLVELTHANTEREVLVNPALVFAIQYSAAHKCTHIISNGGAIVPVSEPVSVVRDKLNQTAGSGKENENGIKTN